MKGGGREGDNTDPPPSASSTAVSSIEARGRVRARAATAEERKQVLHTLGRLACLPLHVCLSPPTAAAATTACHFAQFAPTKYSTCPRVLSCQSERCLSRPPSPFHFRAIRTGITENVVVRGERDGARARTPHQMGSENRPCPRWR